MQRQVFCIHHTSNFLRKRRLLNLFDEIGLREVEWIEGYHPRDRMRWDHDGLSGGSVGETSCGLKHREALRRQVARGIGMSVILEDDVDLPRTFVADLDRWLAEFAELDGDILMIGTAFDMHAEVSDPHRSVYLAPTPHGRATHAYAVPLRAARLFARELEQMPRGIGHDLNDIVQRHNLRMCWVEPGLEQLTMTGEMLSSIETRRTWANRKLFVRARARRAGARLRGGSRSAQDG